MSSSLQPHGLEPQAPPSMEFFRQEYWIGLSFISPGDLPDPGIKPGPPTLQADALSSEPPGKPRLQGWHSTRYSFGSLLEHRYSFNNWITTKLIFELIISHL